MVMKLQLQYIDIINNCYDSRWNTFQWKSAPKKPNDLLIDYDDEDEILTKEKFWANNDIGDDSIPIYGQRDNNGVWRFQWDAGDVGGFIEGEDFNF
jgi:hypothetical protein